jgi:hypothetical protein
MAWETNVVVDFSSSTGWVADPFAYGATGITISGGQATGNAAGYESYYNTTYGGAAGDVEIIISVPTVPSNNQFIVLELIKTLGASYDEYYVTYQKLTGTDTFKLSKATAGGSGVQLGSTASQELSNGNRFGIRKKGSSITVGYYNGTTWSNIITATDSAIAGPYYPAFYLTDSTLRIDDLRVGAG